MKIANMNQVWLASKGKLIASADDIANTLADKHKVLCVCDPDSAIVILETSDEVLEQPDDAAIYIVDKGEFDEVPGELDPFVATATPTERFFEEKIESAFGEPEEEDERETEDAELSEEHQRAQ